MVNGAKETVDAILDHPIILAATIGSSAKVASYLFRSAAEKAMNSVDFFIQNINHRLALTERMVPKILPR